MITWDKPEWFLALLELPLWAGFFVWVHWRRRRLVRAFAAEPALREVLTDSGAVRRIAQGVCYVLAFLFTVLALAGPKWGYHWQDIHRQGIDIFIAMDLSKSMLSEDVKPNRLERAKKEVEDLLDELPADRVGLIAFAGAAFVTCPLTLDHEVARMFLEDLRVGQIEPGGTDIGAAIGKALKSFQDPLGAHKAIVLISDGEDLGGKALATARKAREAGVKVFSVGIGTPTGAPIPVLDEESRKGFLKDRQGKTVVSKLGGEDLQKIALETGGAYLAIGGGPFQLAAIYKSEISKMEKKELGESRKKVYENRFQWPLSLALLLVLAGFIMEEKWVLFPRRLFVRRRKGRKSVAIAA